ncbi:MAG: ATP-binding protein [Hydrogeniiclostridium sp.]
MKKSLFRKYLKITSFTILISFFLLGLVMLSFTTANWQDEKQVLLEKNARNVAAIAAKSATKVADGTYIIGEEESAGIQTFMTAFAENIDSDIFIADTHGNILVYAFASQSDATQQVIPQDLIAKALENRYIGQSTLGNVYKDPCYVVGVPMVVMENGASVKVGVVMAACTFRSFGEYRANLIQMFLLAAVAAFMVSFCIVWLYSYNFVRPLRQMAVAAKSFGEGNFAMRVPVTSSDEIGQLAVAFNNMASSLASVESVRRNFIANVSHELKTPMTTIAGFIDGILDGTIPKEKERQYLGIVSGEVKRLSRLVKTMLDLSRIDSGELHIRPARFDLTATVFNALITFEKSIEDKQIDIRGLADAESIYMDGDPDMIHQVVYNLIENAVKFTNEGGYIELKTEDQPDRTSFTIRNSGAGIPADEISMIFDRFYKTDKSRSKDKTGMGLGLYIVRTIIRLHGGEITVSSVENEYCQFSFWIPKRPSLEPAPKEVKKEPKEKKNGSRSGNKESRKPKEKNGKKSSQRGTVEETTPPEITGALTALPDEAQQEQGEGTPPKGSSGP